MKASWAGSDYWLLQCRCDSSSLVSLSFPCTRSQTWQPRAVHSAPSAVVLVHDGANGRYVTCSSRSVQYPGCIAHSLHFQFVVFVQNTKLSSSDDISSLPRAATFLSLLFLSTDSNAVCCETCRILQSSSASTCATQFLSLSVFFYIWVRLVPVATVCCTTTHVSESHNEEWI